MNTIRCMTPFERGQAALAQALAHTDWAAGSQEAQQWLAGLQSSLHDRLDDALVRALDRAVTAQPPEQPADQRLQLQINTTGAWRKLLEFAASDLDAFASVLESAPLLAQAGGPRASLRICPADGLQRMVCHWAADRGWLAKGLR